EYLFGVTDNLNMEETFLVEQQLEQENRRLIYVAITRAVYKCYISRYTFYSSDTSLIPFVNVIKENENVSEQIAFAISPEINKEYRYSKTINQVSLTPSLAENFKLKEEKWRKLSYSFLASKPIYVQRSNTLNNLTDYEYFIFKQLKKGSITGNMLHHIFENIDFLNNQNWENKIH